MSIVPTKLGIRDLTIKPEERSIGQIQESSKDCNLTENKCWDYTNSFKVGIS